MKVDFSGLKVSFCLGTYDYSAISLTLSKINLPPGICIRKFCLWRKGHNSLAPHWRMALTCISPSHGTQKMMHYPKIRGSCGAPPRGVAHFIKCPWPAAPGAAVACGLTRTGDVEREAISLLYQLVSRPVSRLFCWVGSRQSANQGSDLIGLPVQSWIDQSVAKSVSVNIESLFLYNTIISLALKGRIKNLPPFCWNIYLFIGLLAYKRLSL